MCFLRVLLRRRISGVFLSSAGEPLDQEEAHGFLLLHVFSVSLQDFSVPKILLISGLRGVTGLSTTFLPPLNYFSH